MSPIDRPSWRKPVGVLAMLGYVLVWAVLVASASPWIGQLPVLVQTLVYLVGGVIWIAPLGRWLRWMETGKFR